MVGGFNVLDNWERASTFSEGESHCGEGDWVGEGGNSALSISHINQYKKTINEVEGGLRKG